MDPQPPQKQQSSSQEESRVEVQSSITHDITQDVTQDVSQDSTQDSTQDITQGITQDIPQDVTQDLTPISFVLPKYWPDKQDLMLHIIKCTNGGLGTENWIVKKWPLVEENLEVLVLVDRKSLKYMEFKRFLNFFFYEMPVNFKPDLRSFADE